MIRIEGLTKRFPNPDGTEKLAVDQISFEVNPGEIYGLLGPNGAGKTTLFNVVAGDFLPTSGSVELFGVDVTRLPPYRRTRLGVCRTYQTSQLFRGMTVSQSLFLAIRGVQAGRFSPIRPPAKDQGRIRAIEIAETVNLTDVLQAPVGSLSHGQQRQLEVGMALAGSPHLLMLDEPAAGLSRGERTNLIDLLRRMPREITIVLVEHDMDVALAAADRVTVMHEGMVIVEGSPDEIQGDRTVQDIYLGHAVGAHHG
jgi:branched-chain amino acid transport system ATP-binding protein